MKNYEIRKDFNEAINIGLSSNYICLRVLEQEDSLEQPENNIYTREDIFNNDPKNNWISHKLQAMASLRNKNIEQLTESINHNDPDFLYFEKELEKSKALFISKYNKFTNKNLKFEEVINGYNCHDKDFEELTKILILTPCLSTNNPDLEDLIASYFSYLDIYEKFSIVKSYTDIVEALSDAVNDKGRKTCYYDHPKNPLVKILSSEEISDYIKLTAALYNTQETELKEYHNALTDAYKIGAKKSTDMYFAAQRINDLTTKVSIIGSKTVFAKSAFILATTLEERLKYANTDLTTLYSRVTEKLFDIIEGVSTLGEEKFKINNVYVHQYELDFINFIFKLLETSPSQIKSDYSDKEFNRAIIKSNQRIAKENRENEMAENNNKAQRCNE